jgi:putative methionine-R-sulfoxide reductase with GAF domain
VSTHTSALEEIGRLIDSGCEADELLRRVVAVLQHTYSWVGISFVEEGALVLGPSRGDQTTRPVQIPISYDGKVVAELGVLGDDLDAADLAFLEEVARLISPYCLVGWDTGGEAWSP